MCLGELLMKIGTQDQEFFPRNIKDKFHFLKEAGFEGFEIDGRLLVDHLDEIKEAIAETGIPVTTACGGYTGWIGDFIEERRLNGLGEIKKILDCRSSCMGHVHLPSAPNGFSKKPGG
jgi:sugar phosphate isomerase/epimerase